MHVNPRYWIVQKAKLDIDDAIIKAVEKDNLTYGEIWHIISEISTSWSDHLLKKDWKKSNKQD